MGTKYVEDDLYDDIDDVGAFDYGPGDEEYDETFDTTDELFDEEEDDDFVDYEEFDDNEYSLFTNDEVREQKTTEYTGDFDLSIAEDLYYGIATEKTQIEAIKYAEFFAKKHVLEAQHFIIDAIQNYEKSASEEAMNRTKEAFYMFFRNFVRVKVEQFYKKHAHHYVNIAKMHEDIQDAMSYCWVYIWNDIDKYDYNKAELTTYYRTRIQDAISNFEAKKNFRASKTTMRVDRIVSKAQTALLEQGLKPTVHMISNYCKRHGEELTPEQIKLSSARILAENTMTRIDDENSATNKRKQSRFETPEERIMSQERVEELIEAFRCLTEIEQKVYELSNGFKILIDDHEIIDLDKKCNPNEVAKQLDIDAIEVRRLQFSAGQKLKNAVLRKISGTEPEERKDKLLRNRSLTFSKSQDDDDILTIIDSITSISDTSNQSEHVLPKED